jgi:predicted AAA+ superfamily ATPase
MNKLYSLSTKLNTLVIFRNLLKDPVIESFQKLSGETYHLKSAEVIIKSYGDFVSCLYSKTSCFSDYIVELVMNDENFYVVGKGAGKEFDKVIEDCLKSELKILTQFAAITTTDAKSSISYADFLPEWTNRNVDISVLYHDRIKNLPSTGYGLYARYSAFVLTAEGVMPVKYPDPQTLAQLQGYERERNLIIQNTLSLIAGSGSNNVLLYGDAGTGKSSTIKAVLNEYKSQGLRLIEIKKDQLMQLPNLLEELSINPLTFILFIDDLSFTSNDDSFSALKAVLEGSVASRSNNVAIYATSNRRHLVKENMSDRYGDELHINDTLQETLSLSARFGLKITFQVPDKQDYLDIVLHLAKENDLDIAQDSLFVKAEAFAIRNGGRSPRTAKQFVQMQSILQRSEDNFNA